VAKEFLDLMAYQQSVNFVKTFKYLGYNLLTTKNTIMTIYTQLNF